MDKGQTKSFKCPKWNGYPSIVPDINPEKRGEKAMVNLRGNIASKSMALHCVSNQSSKVGCKGQRAKVQRNGCRA